MKLTGATVHFVNEILPDGGGNNPPEGRRFRPPEHTPELLQRRVMEEAEWQLLPRAVQLAASELERSE